MRRCIAGGGAEKNVTLQTLALDSNQVALRRGRWRRRSRRTPRCRSCTLPHQVGDAGAASLAAALEKNVTKQTLPLSNQVGAAGAASLAAALAKNTTLQLNLDINEAALMATLRAILQDRRAAAAASRAACSSCDGVACAFLSSAARFPPSAAPQAR